MNHKEDAGMNKPCYHDLLNPIRKGRAHYVCRKCGADITLAVVILEEAKNDKEKE